MWKRAYYTAVWRTMIVRFVFIAAIVTSSAVTAQVVKENDAELDRIDVIEHLGDTIPMDLTFTADNGARVRLVEFFRDDKPVLLTLGYYECPMLCNLVFNGLSDAVKKLDWEPGEDFRMLTVGIDPEEGYELAHSKKMNYLKSLEKDLPESAWMFMAGSDQEARQLADAVGFQYFYDEERDEYAHPAVVVLLSPEGKITRYLYGVDFERQDLRLGLLEASEGKIGNTFDRIILYCFHYDPDADGYSVAAGNVMRLGGALALIVLSTFVGLLWYGERRKKRKRAQRDQSEEPHHGQPSHSA
ncbi:SCO family protein [candidate division GN15 bacterium]|nr:SCO family protein [candidate division GN15 bacterium]